MNAVEIKDCRIDRTGFRHAHLKDVTFSGTSGYLSLSDATLDGVDMSGLVAEEITFFGARLRATRLPHTKECFVVRQSTLVDGLTSILQELTPDARNRALTYVDGGGKPEGLFTVAKDWLSGFNEPGDRSLVTDLLFERALREV